MWRFTWYKIPRKRTKKAWKTNCALKESYKKGKEMVLGLSTIKKILFTKVFSKTINIMDGESAIITKDNGWKVWNAALESIEANIQTKMAKKTLLMKGTGKIIDLMDLEPKILLCLNQTTLCYKNTNPKLIRSMNSTSGNGLKASSMDVENS